MEFLEGVAHLEQLEVQCLFNYRIHLRKLNGVKERHRDLINLLALRVVHAPVMLCDKILVLRRLLHQNLSLVVLKYPFRLLKHLKIKLLHPANFLEQLWVQISLTFKVFGFSVFLFH